MKISGATGTGGNIQAQGVGRNGGEDAFSKSIQQQLANLNQQLQQLSSNKNMTPEEKMKKRQEIQQEIANLNQQLRQHQMEQKRQQQTVEKEALSRDSRGVGTAREDAGGLCLSQAGMEAMISADSSMKQARAQGSVATGLEGRVRVMESEIKQDAGRGGNVAKKEAELSALSQRAQNASMAQLSMVADASRIMAEASETEMDAQEQERRDEKGKDDVQGDGEHVQEGQGDTAKGAMPANYKSVDVLL